MNQKKFESMMYIIMVIIFTSMLILAIASRCRAEVNPNDYCFNTDNMSISCVQFRAINK